MRNNLKAVEKNAVDKIVQKPEPRQVKGFGVTVTNRTVAVLLWKRVFTLWRRSEHSL